MRTSATVSASWNTVLIERLETEVLDKPNFKDNSVVNYTDVETPWTQIIEHKWFEFGKDEAGKDLPKTVISREIVLNANRMMSLIIP